MCCPYRYAYADTVGSRRDGRRRFRVCSACCNMSDHKYSGKSLLAPQRIATKWFLNVWIALSALLRSWLCGGTSSYSILKPSIASLYESEISLSSTCLVGKIPLACSRSISTFYALIISPADLFFIPSTSMASLSFSANTMM